MPQKPARRDFLLQLPALLALPFTPPSLSKTASGHVSPRLPEQTIETELALFRDALNLCRQHPFTRYEQSLLNGPHDAFLKNPVRFARQIALALAEIKGTPLATLAPAPRTKFLQLASAGPIGTQNLRGEFVQVKQRLTGKIKPGEFDNWLLRPPSGSLVDCEGGGSVQQIKTICPLNNERPRFCVILDYLTVMNPGKAVVPFQFISARRTLPDLPFANEIGFKCSESMVELGCLNLEEMKIWVFKAAGKTKDASAPSGAWESLEIGKNISQKKNTFGKESETERVLTLSKEDVEKLAGYFVTPPTQAELAEFEKTQADEIEARTKNAQGENKADAQKEGKIKRREEERGYQNSRGSMPVKRVLQAFCEIPLRVPGIDGSADLNCSDPWIFPLEIGILEMTEAEKRRNGFLAQFAPPNTDYFQRPFGERGEVPDWWFRAKFFGEKYPPEKVVINGRKKIPGEETTTISSPSGTL